MKPSSLPAPVRRSLALMLLSCTIAVDARAQAATPSAAFSITKIPTLQRQLVTGDVNNDGRLDLIANSAGEGRPPALLLATGRGDGSFNSPQALTLAAEPVALADLNGDGRGDLLARSGRQILVFPGNGNGTFGAGRVIHTNPTDFFITAVTGAFEDGDAVLDVAVAGTTATNDALLYVYRGRGDFTFDPAVTQQIPAVPSVLRAAHLDNDGVADLVGAASCCTSVLMLLNGGAMTFTVREFLLNRDAGDVRAADLNGDGTTDVVVSLSLPEVYAFTPQRGDVAVLWDGFEAAGMEVFDAGVNGEYALATGDFTEDGRTDIATGNWSIYRDDDLGLQMWSSVSVLAGSPPDPATGRMTFGNPVSFALGTVNWEGYTSSWNLEASDLNGDGRLDLVHAPGAILLNRVPVANRPPAVFAGPDRTLNREFSTIVKSEATDPDGHWLDFKWDNGRTSPWFVLGGSFGVQDPGVYTFAVTVDDGQGGTATDSVTITVPETTFTVVEFAGRDTAISAGAPYTIEWFATDLAGPLTGFHVSYSVDAGRTFTGVPDCINLPGTARSCIWRNPGPLTDRAVIRIEATYGASERWVEISPEFRIVSGPAPLPANWQSRDIGAVSAPGRTTLFSPGIIGVNGSGADIWGTADEFHYAFTPVSGDFDIVTQVQSIEHVADWTKAGLMVRNSISPGAAHVSLFATPTNVKGLSLQSRRQDNGVSTEHARRSVSPQLWLRLMRRGDTVLAAYAFSSAGPWTELPAVTAALSPTVLVGLAVSSHVDGTVATAWFTTPVITPHSGLPAGITSGDVGAVGAAGTAAFAGGTYSIEGSGADVWGTADEFHFVYTQATGDFDVTARAATVEQVNRWTKAGLMIRESTAPGSRHASIFATPSTEKGVAFQARTATLGGSTHISGAAVAPPVWLRLTRSANVIRAFYRTAATGVWTPLGSVTLTGLQGTLLVGMAVSSHVDGTLATATFDNVVLTSAVAYQSADIGAVGVPGTSAADAAGVRLEGSGADIWGTADAFRYYYRPWSGDGTITVRVASVENTNAWAKAGVMFRESLAPNAKHIMAIVSPGKGVAVQYRATAGGTSANVAIASGTAPEWLRLTRAGDTFTAFASEDGTTWRTLGSLTLPMTAAVYVGLPVTSHDNATLATAVFAGLTVEP